MLCNLIISIVAIAQCDAFVFSSRHYPIHGYDTTTLFSHSGSQHQASEHSCTENQHKTWELGLRIDSDPKLSLEYTSSCINQVVGISEAESLEVVTQAYRHGIALIQELPLDLAVSFKTELERCSILCEIVPNADEDGEGATPHIILEDSNDVWELGLLQFATNTREYTSRCLCQVAGLSEVDAHEITSQASRLGVALIGRYHSEHAEHYMAELTRLGVSVCAVHACDE